MAKIFGYELMTLEEAIAHAENARPVGFDLSYSADEDALRTLVLDYKRLKKENEELKNANGTKGQTA